MSTFLFSKFQVEHWLSTGVIALFTWPLPIAVYLAEKLGPATIEPGDDTMPNPRHPEADNLFTLNECFSHSYFNHYWW
jgi:hypothetical protein